METENQLSVIEKSLPVLKNAGAILQANQIKTSKAITVGKSIIVQWEKAWDIEDKDERFNALAAADERSNKYLVNCATALKDEKEARSVVTQIMDEMKKMFTSCENDIDKSKANTTPNAVQDHRDTYVQELAREEKRKREEAEKIALKQKEAVEIKAKVNVRLNELFNSYLLSQKQRLTAKFNEVTLLSIVDFQLFLKGYKPQYKRELFDAYTVDFSIAINTPAEVTALVYSVKTDEKYAEFAAVYESQMKALATDLIDKIPSKKAELVEADRLKEELAKANEQEKERLEAQKKQQDNERQQREQEENDRLQKEAADASKKAEQEAEMKKQTENTMIMFEQQASIASETSAPATRQGYDITVLHPTGFVEIFQFWFTNEGANLPVDKIGNTKMDQMKAFCEASAQKHGNKIMSKFLKYEESFKAINKKVKA